MVAWLRGEPRGLKLLRRFAPILEAQGIYFIVPRGPRIPSEVDVIVAPLDESPEWRMYSAAIRDASHRGVGVILDSDPERALYKAIAYPRDSFSSVAIGVDPGASGCAAAALAEGLLLWVWRGGCRELGAALSRFASSVPHDLLTVYLGDGPGFEEAEDSLAAEGVGYVIVPEEGSTKRPLREPLLARILDRHVLASATIAFRGLSRAQHRRP